MLVLLLFFNIIPSYMSTSQILILDNDTGPDDALAMYLTLFSLEQYVKGITTVRGNTDVEHVIQNDLKTLATSNFNVPIYIGSNEPLSGDVKLTYYFGQDGFGDFEYEGNVNNTLIQEQNAVDFLVDLVKQKPGQVTIICTGPLTNIARAGLKYPKFYENVKLIILGGNVNGNNTLDDVEFNMYADPLAAKYVFESISETNPVVLVPSDAFSGRNTFKKEFRVQTIANINNRIVGLLNKAERISLAKQNYWSPADSMAAFVILKPEIIKEKIIGKPVVDTNGIMTVEQGKTAHIILSFDYDIMETLFIEYLSHEV